MKMKVEIVKEEELAQAHPELRKLQMELKLEGDL